MDKNKLENYSKKLEKEKTDILRELKDYAKPEDFGSDVDHYDEEADEAESLSLRLGLSQELKERLEDIDVALGKIKNGKYGVCEKCGGIIEDRVLDLTPESRFCKNCKKELGRKK